MAKRRKSKSITFEVHKPPAEISFVPPDSILEPYPKEIKLKDHYLETVKRKFKEYIQNGIAWANEQRKNGNPFARHPSEAVATNNLRLQVKKWREEGYPDTTETTRYLLYYWFEHPREKILWFSQREAVETLIYLYEVAKTLKVSKLIDRYGAFLCPAEKEYDQYPRYAFRMATGSGKTLVMALLSVWSFYNYLREDRENYSRFFLFVAPNLIVYDRLRRDLEDLSIYGEFDLIPPDWRNDFRMQVVTRDTFSDKDRSPPSVEEGMVFVTNIHQLGLPTREKKEKEDLISALFDKPYPGKEPYKTTSIKLWDILQNHPHIMIMKDEAHHIHREESKWQKYIWDLHKDLRSEHGKGVFMELDFSATPKDESGALFPWIIVDFSLREALQMGIVKYPAKVVVHDAPALKRGFSLEEFMPYIKAALERWRKHKEKLKEVSKRPVLFIMADEVPNAEAIYERLLGEPDIDASTMVLIHSELEEWRSRVREKGQEIVSKIRINGEEREIDKDLAIRLVRGIDDPDSPIEVIVSVMMLNEGWDVRSVTVILGLRSYASPREILPEQVIGRGLRKLFPNEGVDIERWINVLEVVGPPKLLEVLNKLEDVEGIKIPEAPDKFFISFNSRIDAPDEMKFPIPRTESLSFVEHIETRALLTELFSRLPKGVFKYSDVKKFQRSYEYEVVDMRGTTLDRGEIRAGIGDIPAYQLASLARELQKEIPLPNSFGLILEELEQYIGKVLFDGEVALNEDILSFLSAQGWFAKVREQILQVARELIKNPTFSVEIQIGQQINVDQLGSFPWYKDFVDSEKSLFVRVAYEDDAEKRIPSAPVDNEMEAKFVSFLTRAEDVVSFVKNVPHVVRFSIHYYDTRERRWAKFYPDFLVKTNHGYCIVETKGREEIQIVDKNVAANKWCEAITHATGKPWVYLYVRESDWHGKSALGEISGG
ncbi:MAG: hypothetical protein DRP27_07105 [Thermotogae bacterium]|nr:MAG: hypothetical protein DRP27_07105 [Thermotogota bacterium]